ncbi:hypothetical protein AM1_0883 [Acaryochloris marina MBIC11017]|uniref:Uncharacterized protein n=1 Tax=Acaryochloris marina (strain MBIC 11017) TaxID=329726 RepID=B0BYP0_ACAM1|nr:hypothetical protein AM1_0883 [Acaryochloris marina MBIC11017]
MPEIILTTGRIHEQSSQYQPKLEGDLTLPLFRYIQIRQRV